MQEYKTLNDYVKEIKGDRTVKQFADDAGISLGTAIKYLNGTGKGGYKTEILKRIVKEEAQPQGNVSLRDLLAAMELETDNYARERYDYECDEGYGASYACDNTDVMVNVNGSHPIIIEKKTIFPEREEYFKAIRTYEHVVRGIIAEKAIKSEGEYSLSSDACNDGFQDVSLAVNNETNIKTWDFELKYMQTKGFNRYRAIYTLLGRYLFEGINPEHKQTIIINDKEMFKLIKTQLEKSGLMPFKGDLSVILYDEEKLEITEEMYLATYSEESQLFYL